MHLNYPIQIFLPANVHRFDLAPYLDKSATNELTLAASPLASPGGMNTGMNCRVSLERGG